MENIIIIFISLENYSTHIISIIFEIIISNSSKFCYYLNVLIIQLPLIKFIILNSIFVTNSPNYYFCYHHGKQQYCINLFKQDSVFEGLQYFPKLKRTVNDPIYGQIGFEQKM
jgi:hypothetical protein